MIADSTWLEALAAGAALAGRGDRSSLLVPGQRHTLGDLRLSTLVPTEQAVDVYLDVRNDGPRMVSRVRATAQLDGNPVPFVGVSANWIAPNGGHALYAFRVPESAALDATGNFALANQDLVAKVRWGPPWHRLASADRSI